MSIGDTLKDTNRLKVKGWKEICHENSNHRKAGMVILISDKKAWKQKCYRDKRDNPPGRYNSCKHIHTQ